MKKYFNILSACIIAALMITNCFPAIVFATENLSRSTVWGVYGGPSFPGGYYEQKLNAGISAGTFFIPYISSLYMIEGNLAASYYTIQGSDESVLYDVHTGAGILLYYPLFSFLMPYGGASLSVHYVRFKGDLSGGSEDTWKPGYFIKAGALIPCSEKILFRIGAEYGEHDLSDKTFRTVQFTGGIAYRFRSGAPDDEKTGEVLQGKEAERLYRKGVEEFNARNPLRAEGYFRKVMDIRNDYKDTAQYIAKTEGIRNTYNNAVAEETNGHLFPALEKYIVAARDMKDAEGKLSELRRKLAYLVPVMEKNGIHAYQAGNYRSCIDEMKKVLLVSPERRNAILYLQRAAKHQRALERLQ